MAILELENVGVNYGKVRALKKINLSVVEGQYIGLIGPNGAGKSTLLNMISGLLSDQKGHVIFDDKDISHMKAAERVQLGIIQCPERRHLFPYMSVRDNLMLGAFNRKARKIWEENIEYVFDLFPVLKSKQSDQAITLSGGQSQMLAVGRAIMSIPRLLMLDEPMLGVAPALRQEFSLALDLLKNKNLTVLITEQELYLTMKNTDTVLLINNGVVTEGGTPEELKKNEDLQQLYFSAVPEIN